MKKKHFNSLKLNKNSVSNLQSHTIYGGGFTNSEIICSVTYTETQETCINTHCDGGIVCDLQYPTGKE